jgi:putative Holliday junction resolvase
MFYLPPFTSGPDTVRYLAIDLGDKRTGLAMGDAITCVVTPVGVLEVPINADQGKSLLHAVVKAINETGPRGLVIGLPLNMDDTEGRRAKLVRAWTISLQAHLPAFPKLSIHFQDERLTSADADWQMARTGLTRGEKKAKRDALAAATLLRDFLAAQAKLALPRASDEPSDHTP